MRPVDDHLVGVGEPRRGGEYLPRVAHRHVIPEELPDPGDGGGEVDRPENQHPGRRRERVHEDAQLVPAALTLRTVPADTGQALGKHAPRVVVDRRVQPRSRAQGARRPDMPGFARHRRAAAFARSRFALGIAGPDNPSRADLAGTGDHRRDRDRLAALDRGGDLAELGETGRIYRLHEDVDDPAAGEPDRERVVVAHAVGLEDRAAGPAYVERQFVDGAFDASAGDAADDLAVGGGRYRQRRAWVTWRAAVCLDHGGQAEGLPRLPPLRDPVQDVAHVSPRPLISSPVPTVRGLTGVRHAGKICCRWNPRPIEPIPRG